MTVAAGNGIYLPFIKRPQVVALGLEPLDIARWIEPDADLPVYFHNKCELLATNKAQFYRDLPESLEAQAELHDRLLRHLLQDHSRYYKLDGSQLQVAPLQRQFELDGSKSEEEEPDLLRSSLWVPDDLCILQRKDNTWQLTAASVCAPSAWQLQDKIGRPLFDIHQPVPSLNERIGNQIQHVFDKLSPLRPVQRFNWSLVASRQLARLPGGDVGLSLAEPSEAGLYLRVERQTLVCLPTTGAIVFTIRVYVNPLEELIAIPGAIDGLKNAVEGLSAAEANYKSILPIYPQFRKFCKAALKRNNSSN